MLSNVIGIEPECDGAGFPFPGDENPEAFDLGRSREVDQIFTVGDNQDVIPIFSHCFLGAGDAISETCSHDSFSYLPVEADNCQQHLSPLDQQITSAS